MSIWLEEKIKDAILAVRWKRAGDGLHPSYFVEAPPESFQLEGSSASFLAHFIAARVVAEQHQPVSVPTDSVVVELDKYSPEVIASYLEDQGYTVSSPE
jgi:hypothetical protein